MAQMMIKKDPSPAPAFTETVEEIMKLYKSLPPRPSIEDIEAAVSVIKTVNYEEQQKIQEISKQEVPQDVPEELFDVLQQVRKSMVVFQSHQQRKEAAYLVEIDKIFENFDDLIRKASELVSGDSHEEEEELFNLESPDGEIHEDDVVIDEMPKKDDTQGLLTLASPEDHLSSSVVKGGEGEKLSLLGAAAVIEKSARLQVEVLDLQGKLMDKIEWLPTSLGKLSNVVELNLSNNQIMALPTTISSLKKLRKLDIHANQLINLPDTFGELSSLTDLDLHSNRLKSLPASFGNLTSLINLDLSLNRYTTLPDIVGNLTSLKRLIMETNDLEELPYTIGSCSSLVELRLDFNRLKALPEAVGKLEFLEILTLRYNRIRVLPTTMDNPLHLKELDVSFNELESLPESICLARNLKKLNTGNNFADLRALPNSIGNLEMLEELDISDNQIKVLPDSFRFLANLKVFRADETPLEVPPRKLVKLGAQAVVKYMAEFVVKRNLELQRPKKKVGLCSLFSKCLGFEARSSLSRSDEDVQVA
ncbi:hypothetical protein M9H77_00355 [Catharanthus roseus]|nr:hypothetical protein M9H77_00355 [Catharanthus roseus]